MNELAQCQHGTDGMHIAGTIIGFDCNDCLSDMVKMTKEAVETNLDKLPRLSEEEAE